MTAGIGELGAGIFHDIGYVFLFISKYRPAVCKESVGDAVMPEYLSVYMIVVVEGFLPVKISVGYHSGGIVHRDMEGGL